MNFNKIKEICLYVTDLDKTRDFYSGKLGLPEIGFSEGRHIFFRCEGSVLLCFIADSTLHEKHLPLHGASGIIHLAFEVPASEYEQTKQNVIAAGIKISHEQNWGAHFDSFYFSDPDGNLLEVVPEGMWEHL